MSDTYENLTKEDCEGIFFFFGEIALRNLLPPKVFDEMIEFIEIEFIKNDG